MRRVGSGLGTTVFRVVGIGEDDFWDADESGDSSLGRSTAELEGVPLMSWAGHAEENATGDATFGIGDLPVVGARARGADET